MLIDNILFLRDKFPEIRKYFLEHEKDLDVDRIDILPSKSGAPTARYSIKTEEKELMVHSKYDPIREAERLMNQHVDKITSDTHVIFFGIGMGYHIEKFKELYPDLTYSIYEPLPEMFYMMSNEVKLERLISNKTANLYMDRHDKETYDYLEEFQSENRAIHLIVLPSYNNIAKVKKEQFLENVKETILNRRSNLHTNASFQKLWVTNSIRNFKEVLNTPNIMKDIEKTKFEGKPAIIVSAGPSLAEDIEHLRYIKDNNLAYIFSVGSAINSLIEYDVLPDAVFTYDPSQQNQKVFEKMVEKKVDDVPLVFGSSIGYGTLEKLKGPKLHFITSQDRTSIYYLKEQLDIDKDLILDSPSIAVMTFQILNKLGMNPIIFAGQNLGYLYNRIYSKGIEYDHVTSNFVQKRLSGAITTKDVYGNEIKTNVGFNNMRKSIEGFAKVYQDKMFINTTKGGAAINGIPFQPIEKVIDTLLTKKVEKQGWWSAKNHYDLNKFINQQDKILESINGFNNLIKHFEGLLNSIEHYTMLRIKHKLEMSFNHFDTLYDNLMENIYYSNFLSFYIRVQVEYMSNEIRLINQEKDNFKKGKNIVKVFSEFIKSCKRSSLELEKTMEYIMR